MRIAAFGAAAAFLAAGAMLSGTASAQLNQLEIREPKVEAGEVELEYLGDYNFGQPRRRAFVEPSGDLLFDANEFARQRHTFGVGYGLTRWLGLQIAVEAEQERLDDPEAFADARAFGALKVTEIEVESTIVLIPTPRTGLGVAALVEYNFAIDRDEADQLFLGAALQYAWGAWSATANLYAVRHVGGREELEGTLISDERWDFQYAAQLKYGVNDKLALALEAYGVIERLGRSGTKSEEREHFGDFDRHLLGPVLYYSWGGDDDRGAKKRGKGPRVRGASAKGKSDDNDRNGGNEGPSYTAGAGVLFGLDDTTSDVVLKWTLGAEF
jgi:hypothetical protein